MAECEPLASRPATATFFLTPLIIIIIIIILLILTNGYPVATEEENGRTSIGLVLFFVFSVFFCSVHDKMKKNQRREEKKSVQASQLANYSFLGSAELARLLLILLWFVFLCVYVNISAQSTLPRGLALGEA